MREILEVLCDSSTTGDEKWRSLSRSVFHGNAAVDHLERWFAAISEFDDTFRRNLQHRVTTPSGTVLVAGSGKDSFKTFNVTTASAVVAAAAGVPVVKGVSRSVSGVSGSLDVLEVIGIPVATNVREITLSLRALGISFVDYRTFCPRFFDRYDGHFTELQAASLFMPLVALCVDAVGFVYGLSTNASELAARIISRIRPDLLRGVAVGTELSPGNIIDERASCGRSWRSDLRNGIVATSSVTNAAPDLSWLTAVGQRPTHLENAQIFQESLGRAGSHEVSDLVIDNAALIIETGLDVSPANAQSAAEHVLGSGQASELLRSLCSFDNT